MAQLKSRLIKYQIFNIGRKNREKRSSRASQLLHVGQTSTSLDIVPMMTHSGSQSRHMACKTCRDRKVKCDGKQPACEKCQRSGESCIYAPTNKPTRADLAQTMDSLQERLDKAEAYIAKLETQGLRSNSTSSQPARGWTDATSVMDCSPFMLQFPTFGNSSDSLVPNSKQHGSGPAPVIYEQGLSGAYSNDRLNELMNYAPNGHGGNMAGRSDLHQFPCEDELNGGSGPGPGPGHGTGSDKAFTNVGKALGGRNNSGSEMDLDLHVDEHNPHHVPSLREIRAQNESALAQPHASSPMTPPPGNSPAEVKSSEDLARVMAELSTLWTIVSTTQAEIAGVSSIMAEYLAWMRKSVSVGAPTRGALAECATNANSSGNHGAVLGILEKRARELQSLAETRHQEVWVQAVERLGAVDPGGTQLQELVMSLDKRTGEITQFFQNIYDIRSPLDEQLQNPGRRGLTDC